MRTAFYVFLVLSAIMMWGAIEGGTSPHHGGSWLAAGLGLLICQPWVLPVTSVLHPTANFADPLSLGVSALLNALVLGYFAFRKRGTTKAHGA